MLTSPLDIDSFSAIKKRYQLRFLAAIALSILTAIAILLPLLILNHLFHILFDSKAILTALFLLPAVFIAFLCQGLTLVYCHSLAFSVVHALRDIGLMAAQHLPPTEVEKNISPLKKLMIDDCAEFETAIAHNFPDAVISLATVGISIVFLTLLSPWMTIASLALLPIAGWAGKRLSKVAASNSQRWYQADLQINRNLISCLEGLTTLKIFNRLPSSLPSLTKAIDEITYIASDMPRRSLGAYVMLFICLGTNLVTVLPCALFLHSRHQLSFPDTLFGILLGMGLVVSLQRLIFASDILPRLRATLYRLASLSDLKSYSISNIGTETAPLLSKVTRYEVTFENIGFVADNGNPILDSISLTCPAGKVTGLVGESGAGKTTLLQLVVGYLKPTTGRILIGGQDLANLSPQERSRLICPVFQHPFLLGKSLADNLRLCCPDITPSKISNILALCDLSDCLDRFGQEGAIGRNAARLSGGERQRLALARALVSPAPIILLDEPTSAVDPERELHLQQALAQVLHGRTILVVAYRLTTVQDAAKIAVFRQGHLVAQGKHDDLLATSPLYAAYAKPQFADGEAL